MGLLYIKEHTSCYNYCKCIKEGFTYRKFLANNTEEINTDSYCILFVLSGTATVSNNGDEVNVSKGNMLFLNKGEKYIATSQEEGYVVVAKFENKVQGCEKLAFSQLSKYVEGKEGILHPLEIKENIQSFLDLLIVYLQDGANCFHFHEIKLKELFWVIRFYYTKEEQANFFYPIIGKELDFKQKVLKAAIGYKTVKQIASDCGYSLSTFQRRFQEEFKETATAWLTTQIINQIKFKLTDLNLSIENISDELNFSNSAYFSRYCKNNMGCTPTDWRKFYKQRKDL